MTYVPDTRSQDELLADLEGIADRISVPGASPRSDGSRPTWADVLADDTLTRDLMEQTLGGVADLLVHFAELPTKAASHWLESTLGIERLPAVPASAVVVAQVADGAAPVLVEPGTQLKGPKDDAGAATVFSTTDSLVATGATVIDVGAYGRRAAADTSSVRGDGSEFDPFASPIPATHELIIGSESFAFTGGRLVAELDFGVDVTPIRDLIWTYSGLDGEVEAARPTKHGSTKLRVTMLDGCVPAAIGTASHPYIKASFRPDEFDAAVAAFNFATVTVRVQSRDNIIPDAAFYNDGVVDVSKEFKPFGDVPKRGDAFYLQCDEAFAKPLDELDVTLSPLDSAEFAAYEAVLMYGGAYWTAISQIATETSGPSETAEILAIMADDNEPTAAAFGVERAEDLLFESLRGSSVSPTIDWQILSEASWFTKEQKTSLVSTELAFSEPSGDPAVSDETTLGNVTGRFVRAFLSAGDFGWDRYLQDLADFATAAAGDGGGTMPTAPKPPLLASVRLAYSTHPVAPDTVQAISGLARMDMAAGGQPFSHPVGQPPSGAVYVGLDFPDKSLGQTLSTYFDVDASAACAASTDPVDTHWEVWNGTSFDPIAVADATASLRTSGLVRFVAPATWPTGCSETDATTGRWFRLRTNHPEMVGTVKGVYPDAVIATAPLGNRIAASQIDEVKGPMRRIEGIDKLTNPVRGTASAAIEDDGSYVVRAPQVVRTRNRLIQPVDYEMEVLAKFPEVAFAACLPHYGPSGSIQPGRVAVVVIPDSDEPAPLPSADLVVRVESELQARAPIHAAVSIVCPDYTTLSVTANIVLTRGEAALTARSQIAQAIDDFLHPLQRDPDSLGRPVYRSEIIGLLEGLPVVDRVQTLNLNNGAERVDPPAGSLVGMVVSSGSHDLELLEQLT